MVGYEQKLGFLFKSSTVYFFNDKVSDKIFKSNRVLCLGLKFEEKCWDRNRGNVWKQDRMDSS